MQFSCVPRGLGYRYELYCASKAARSTQCTIYCAISRDNAWQFNGQRTDDDHLESHATDNSPIPYSREMFDALILRYEEPIANNRWDSPLFTVLVDTTPPFDDISAALFERKPPPPNLATQNVRIVGGGNVAATRLLEANNTKHSKCRDVRSFS